nr:tyrosine-type recombinase/integrase [uncultured Devosia sp.]
MPSIRIVTSATGIDTFDADFKPAGVRLVTNCKTIEAAMALLKTDPDYDGLRKPPFTLDHLIERYDARCVKDGLRSLRSLRKRFAIILAHFPDRPAASITASEVAAFATKLGETRVHGSVCGTIQLLGSIYREAVKSELLSSDPTIPVCKHYTRPPTPPAAHIIKAADAAKLIAATRDDREEALLRLVLECGLRVGEVAALCWDRIDGGTISITHTLTDDNTVKPTTPERTRPVPMTPQLLGVFARMASALGDQTRKAIFPGRGRPHLSDHAIREIIVQVQLRASVLSPAAYADGHMEARYLPSELRNRAAAAWLEASHSPMLVARWFGIKKFSNFARKFQAYRPEARLVRIDALDTFMRRHQPNQTPPNM